MPTPEASRRSQGSSRKKDPLGQPCRQAGFSMVEVLVAMVITAVGLLGVAFLLTFSIQRTQSSEQLGVAADFGYQALDLMRANKLGAFRMAGANGARATTCAVAEASALTPEGLRARWDCDFNTALPSATATWSYLNGVGTVTITWNRDRGDANASNTVLTYQAQF